MSDIQALKRKHQQLIFTAKIKELSYTIQILKSQNQKLVCICQEAQKKLKIKSKQITQLMNQVDKLKEPYEVKRLLARKKESAFNKRKMDNRQSKQKCTSVQEIKMIDYTSSTEDECVPEDIQKMSRVLIPSQMGRIEQKYQKYFGDNDDLKQLLLGFIEKSTNTYGQQLLINVSDIFQGLTDYLQRSKKPQIQTLLQTFIKDVQLIDIDDDDQDTLEHKDIQITH